MHINSSGENYLETILILSKKRPVVRSEGYINLTESGKEIATQIYERHVLLSSWLERLGVDPDIAAQDACRIEHVISSESFEALKKHIK